MKRSVLFLISWLTLTALLLAACTPAPMSTPAAGGALKVVAVETFLADIAQNVAGERAQVEALMPLGVDPHAFELTPQDVARVAQSQVLIVNGGGVEGWLADALANVGGDRLLIEASAGLTSRTPQPGEGEGDADYAGGDPHYWLDPLLVVKYVENIRDGLSQTDPDGAEIYARNAASYIAQLQELDGWIREQVNTIPAERRLMVTNHESFGYFADRYGLRIVGAVIPSVSSEASPSAQQMASLVEQIRATGASAIFVETGANPKLAEQIARETGVKVVTGLYTHSVSAPDGEAPTYLAMMRYNAQAICDALR